MVLFNEPGHACMLQQINESCMHSQAQADRSSRGARPIDGIHANILASYMVYMEPGCTWTWLSMFYLQTLAGGRRCCQWQYARTRSMMAGLMDQLQSYRFVESRLDVHDSTSFCTIAHTVYRVFVVMRDLDFKWSPCQVASATKHGYSW
jgi:hypothetical protein